jgi:hypothetical protein
VLHAELVGYDAAKLKDAVASKEPPMAVVVPKDFVDPTRPKRMLSEAGLWFL